MSKKQDILRDIHAVATPLVVILVDKYGTECLDWEQETINEEMTAMAGGKVPKMNFDKVASLAQILTTDRFFVEPKVFSVISNAIGGEDDGPVLFTAFDPPHPEECAWSVFEALLHRPLEPEETTKDRFSPKVRRYIGSILAENGHMLPPKPIDFVEVPREETTVADEGSELYTAVWDLQSRNNQLVTGYVSDRMKLLLGQMEGLHLSAGSTDELVKRLSRFQSAPPSAGSGTL